MTAPPFGVVDRRGSEAPTSLELIWGPGGRPGLLRRVDPAFDAVPVAAEALRREIAVARQAPIHSSLVPFFSADDGTHPWLAREWERGHSLDTLLASGVVLRGSQILTLITDALVALDVLHGARLVHGDPSPANLLVNESGRVRLADPASARRFFARGMESGADSPVVDQRRLMAWVLPMAAALPREAPLAYELQSNLAAQRVETSFRAVRLLAVGRPSDPLLGPFPTTPPRKPRMAVTLAVLPLAQPELAGPAAGVLATRGLGDEATLRSRLSAGRTILFEVPHPEPYRTVAGQLAAMGVRVEGRSGTL